MSHDEPNNPQPKPSDKQIEQRNQGSMQGGMQSIIGNNNTQTQDNRTYINITYNVLPLEQYDLISSKSAFISNPSNKLGISKALYRPSDHKQSIEELEHLLEQGFVEPLIPGSQEFEFTVVMVDAQGKELIRRQRKARYLIEDLGTEELEMMIIPGGKFLMGSSSSEVKRFPNDEPQHWVTIKPFLMSKYPIMKGQWKSAISALPKITHDLKTPRFGGVRHPITDVSWYEAVEFCNRLSQTTGHTYRLPSEAEWEFACRAGTKTPFHFGETIISDLANYDGNYPYRSGSKGINREKTTSVEEFQFPNAFGLFDMHGNVSEWCLDHWHESYKGAPSQGEAWIDNLENQYRVTRGGSWKNEALLCRSAQRGKSNATQKTRYIGFRIVRSLG